MSIRRVFFGLAGMGAVSTAIIAPGSVQARLMAAVDAVGNDYIFVGMVAVIGIFVAVTALFSGRDAKIHRARLPDPERPVRGTVPGAHFDDVLCSWRIDLPILGQADRRRVRERIREAGIRTVMSSRGCARATAENAIDRGEWTEDATAGEFLALDSAAGTRRSSRIARFSTRARRTIDVLEATSRSNGSREVLPPRSQTQNERTRLRDVGRMLAER